MGGGNGKSVNVELNLVPFIDLLSTLICFLLITAAWQELDVVSTNAPPKITSDAPNQPIPPPPIDEKPKVALTVTLGVDQTDVAEDTNIQKIDNLNGEPDVQKLGEVLDRWKTQYPDRSDLVFVTENHAKYKYLVRYMDLFIQHKFPDVSISLN